MEKIHLEILGLSSSNQSHIGHYALILGEVDGNRRLPIIIGSAEARAIALELESIKPNRPMTHDLIFNMVTYFDMELVEVVINNLSEGIFYARLILEHDGEFHELDSRPSDAVALAVRFRAPIYTYESIMQEAGIKVDDDEKKGKEEELELDEIEKPTPAEEQRLSVGEQMENLNKKLEDALGREDYENAAKIRDQINQLRGNS